MVWGVIRLMAVGGGRKVKRVRPSYLFSTMQLCLLAIKDILGWIAFSKFCVMQEHPLYRIILSCKVYNRNL